MRIVAIQALPVCHRHMGLFLFGHLLIMALKTKIADPGFQKKFLICRLMRVVAQNAITGSHRPVYSRFGIHGLMAHGAYRPSCIDNSELTGLIQFMTNRAVTHGKSVMYTAPHGRL